MDEKAVRGVPWTVLSYAANRLVLVVSTLLLARLLVPADFGLFALATLATGFVSIFGGLGLGNILVLRQDLDARQQGTILTLLLAAGIAFALLLAAASPLLALLFDEPRLTMVVLALAGYLSFTGINWFYESLLQRELEFKRRFVTQMVRTVVYAAVALLVAAVFEGGVWALVIAQAAAHVANGVALLLLTPYRVPFAFDARLARDVVRSGGGFVAQGAAAFAQQNVDYIVVGRLLGTSQLGLYSLAYRQAELTYAAIAEPLARVTFPAFARMRHEGQDVSHAYLSGLRYVALASFPVGVVLSGAADPFVRALFGERWLAMIGPLTVLGAWAAVRPLETTAGWLLNSVGHAGLTGRVALFLLVPLVPALVLAAAVDGITAVSWVILGHISVSFVVLIVMGQRCGGPTVRAQLRVLAPLLPAAVLAWIASRLTAGVANGLPAFPVLVLASVAGFGVYLVAVAVLDRPLLASAWRQGRRAVGRSTAARGTTTG